jgi:uncharacterized delta-60 repeat protein
VIPGGRRGSERILFRMESQVSETRPALFASGRGRLAAIITWIGLLVLPLSPSLSASTATDGALDTSFDVGTGANSLVRAVVVQPDGKVLIGGDFIGYNDVLRQRIARINTDGSLDTSFPSNGTDGRIDAVALQADGKILIGGIFTEVGGVTRNGIARLNADGSRDDTFNPGTGANGAVRFVSVQTDGKILINGAFTSYDGTARNRIARLNADGSLDTTFNPGTGANASVRQTVVQDDGRILIGGDLTAYDGTLINGIARINADGTRDTTFTPGNGTNGQVWFINVQPDGKILISGTFTSFNGTARNRIARLNADGTLDTTFNPGTGGNASILQTVVQQDGRILIGGDFTSFNGTSINRIARINADGSLDTTFNPGTGANFLISSVALQADAKILIGGGFTSYNGTPISRIARLLNSSAPIGLGGSGSGRFVLPPVEHRLGFDANGGTCTLTNSGPIIDGVWIKVPDEEQCTRPGYTLLGWNPKPDGSDPLGFDPGGWTLMTDDNTLYAIWVPVR